MFLLKKKFSRSVPQIDAIFERFKKKKQNSVVRSRISLKHFRIYLCVTGVQSNNLQYKKRSTLLSSFKQMDFEMLLKAAPIFEMLPFYLFVNPEPPFLNLVCNVYFQHKQTPDNDTAHSFAGQEVGEGKIED